MDGEPGTDWGGTGVTIEENRRHAEKKTNELLGVLERAQAFVTQGDVPVTVRPGKMHADFEKADSDFVRYLIVRMFRWRKLSPFLQWRG